MKKSVVFLLIVLQPLFVAAQVTLHANHLPENYYYTYWLEVDSTSQFVVSESAYVLSPKVHAKQFITKDSLQVWGVAASLETLTLFVVEWDQYGPDGEWVHMVDSSSYYSTLNQMCDTSDYEEAYEFFGLYRRVSDTLQLISPQLKVNIKTTPVTYYLDLGTEELRYYPGRRTRPFPVYELYFEKPITISSFDTFYIGMTSRIYYRDDKCASNKFYTWPICWRTVVPRPGPTSCPDGIAYYQSNPAPGFWNFYPTSPWLYYIFPIMDTLHRNDYIDTTSHGNTDTVSHGGDGNTVGIGNSPLESYISIQPNPAHDVVRVVSSVGMSEIEVIDMKGFRVLKVSDCETEVSLDVKSLPKGVYVLRVQTPLGIVDKRLIVR